MFVNRCGGIIKSNSSGKYLWAKFDSTGETLIELVVDNNLETYPDGAVQDGYYYQRIVYVVGADDVGTYLLEL